MIFRLPTGTEGIPTAPIADFNNAIIPGIHGRPLELIFGIPAALLLIVAAVVLIGMVRRAR
jgi:hypothetical protein